LGVALALAARTPGGGLTCAAVVVFWGAAQLELAELFSGARIPLRFLWVALLVPLIAAPLVISSWLYPRVDWRGRGYGLGRAARLHATS
jgi:hypothetical protein